jgi:hypothetical protein
LDAGSIVPSMAGGQRIGIVRADRLPFRRLA